MVQSVQVYHNNYGVKVQYDFLSPAHAHNRSGQSLFLLCLSKRNADHTLAQKNSFFNKLKRRSRLVGAFDYAKALHAGTQRS